MFICTPQSEDSLITTLLLSGVSVVSLDKALETNHLTARVGDNVEIKCDVTGSPVPPIVWRRNQLDLSTLNEEDVRVFSDGSLYLTRIQLQHAGNYTCHAQRNKDVVQTHILTVHSEQPPNNSSYKYWHDKVQRSSCARYYIFGVVDGNVRCKKEISDHLWESIFVCSKFIKCATVRQYFLYFRSVSKSHPSLCISFIIMCDVRKSSFPVSVFLLEIRECLRVAFKTAIIC